MNSCSESRTSSEPTGMPIVWKLGLGAALVMGFVTALVLLLFPIHNGPLTVVASNLGLIGATHFPEGQLQADAKTLVAELKWIFLPDLKPTLLPTGLASTNQPLKAPEVSQSSRFHLPASQRPGETVAPGCT